MKRTVILIKFKRSLLYSWQGFLYIFYRKLIEFYSVKSVKGKAELSRITLFRHHISSSMFCERWHISRNWRTQVNEPVNTSVNSYFKGRKSESFWFSVKKLKTNIKTKANESCLYNILTQLVLCFSVTLKNILFRRQTLFNSICTVFCNKTWTKFYILTHTHMCMCVSI